MSLDLEHAIGANNTFVSTGHFLPNGIDFVTSVGGCVTINSVQDKHDQRFLSPPHDTFVSALAVSADGRFAASGQNGQNADVFLWDLEKQILRFKFQEHDFGVQSICFTHDSRYLISGGVDMDGRLLVYDCETGLMIAWAQLCPKPTIQIINGGHVKNIKRRNQTQYQLASCGGMKINIWSLDNQTSELTGNLVAAAGKQQRDFCCLAFSEDYEWLYSGTTTGDVVIILMKNLVIQHYIPQCSRNGVRSIVSFTPSNDHHLFIVGGGDGTITTFSGTDHTLMHDRAKIQLDSAVNTISLSSDKNEMVAITQRGTVARIKSHDLMYSIVSQSASGEVFDVTFPHGASDTFLTCGKDGSILQWDGNNYACKVACHEKGIVRGHPICCTGSLDICLAGYDDGRIRSFDMRGEMLWRIDNAHKKSIRCIELAQSVRFVMTGGDDGDLRVWEIKTRDLISNLKEHTGGITDMALFANDQYAATVSHDRCLLTWDLRQERRLTAHRERHAGFNCLAIASDQSTVLTAGGQKNVTYWDLRSADPVRSIESQEEVNTIAISSNDHYFVTAGSDLILKLWDYRMGKMLSHGKGHSSRINQVTWSPDCKQIVSVADDYSVMIWNVYG